MSLLEIILNRRSVSALQEPGPNENELQLILQAAGTVPDHGSLKPYRFIVVRGHQRQAFADAMVASAEELSGDLDETKRKKIIQKAFMAPLQVLIIFSPQAHPKIPEWEQMASASCTGYSMLLAAHSLGLGAVWKSFAFDSGQALKQLLNLKDSEKFLGWINVGTKVLPTHNRDLTDPKSYTRFL